MSVILLFYANVKNIKIFKTRAFAFKSSSMWHGGLKNEAQKFVANHSQNRMKKAEQS